MDYTVFIFFTDYWTDFFTVDTFLVLGFVGVLAFVLRFILLDLLFSVDGFFGADLVDYLLPWLVAVRLFIFLYFSDLKWRIFFELGSGSLFSLD